MLLTFGGAVSVYQLGQTGLVAADVVSGEWQPAVTSSKQQQQQHGAFHIHSPEPLHVASLQTCQGVAENIIDSWRCACMLCCVDDLSTLACDSSLMSPLRSCCAVWCWHRHPVVCAGFAAMCCVARFVLAAQHDECMACPFLAMHIPAISSTCTILTHLCMWYHKRPEKILKYTS